MPKSYKDITQELSTQLAQWHKEMPDFMKAFGGLSQAAVAPGALDKKTKELIALAIGVSSRCDGCIGFHTQALIKLGATKAEILETLSMAVYMGGGPSMIYAAYALKAYDEFAGKE